MIRFVVLIAAMFAADMAIAKAPAKSLRPVARPLVQAVEGQPEVAVASTSQMAVAALRPQARPERAARAAQTMRAETPEVEGIAETDAGGERVNAPVRRAGLLASLRPLLRPRAVSKKGAAAQAARAQGAVCGDPAIQGDVVGFVPGKINGCGVEDAVRVRSVSGVALSRQAVMDCVTAKSLKRWIGTGMKPAVGSSGGGVARIDVVASYACRSRNSQKGNRISEHGKGRAVDIAAFTLHDGTEISVLNDWDNGRKGRILRGMHKSACGPFGTVLGPESDRHHRDHFHFDTARYRGGAYCR